MGTSASTCSLGVAAQIGVLASALAMMTSELRTPVHGNFYFRQAHVAANIEHFITNGLSLVPETYNLDVPYRVFDFPLYQLVVASLCRAFRTDPLTTSRVVNLVIFALTFFLIDRLLAAAGVRWFHRVGTSFLFCWAPMNLFFYPSPMVDPLAIGLSLLSLFGFLRLEGTERGNRAPWFLLMLSSGILSAIIKSPVYLPVFVAVIAQAARERFARLSKRELVAYISGIGVSVFAFKIWSNHVNGVRAFFDANEPRDYFGPLTDRFDPESWHRIDRVLIEDAANPLTAALALVGIVLWVASSRSRYKALFSALAGGWLLTLLVFFNRFTWHNYYLLGSEIPIAFFGAYALDRAAARNGAWRGLTAPAIAIVATFTVYASTVAWRALASTPTDWIQARGEFIRDSTLEDDFVVYLVESQDFEDWNPVFLYFAHRHGYNLTTRRMDRRPRILSSLEKRYSRAGSRFLVYCPSTVTLRYGPVLESRGRLLDAGPAGRLYVLGEAQGSSSSRHIEITGPGRSTPPGL